MKPGSPSKRYAKALFELARASGANAVDSTAKELDRFAKLLEQHRDLTSTLSNPSYALSKRHAVLSQLIERVGAELRNPFDNAANDIPMTALCRAIERDLRQVLGETDIPPAIEPENGILM